jgi:hypothetical protein
VSLWLVAAFVALAGLLPVAIAALRAGEEIGNFRRQLRDLGQLRPAVVELAASARTLRASLRERGRP